MADLATESPTIRSHNDAYVARHIESQKSYLDNILKACDPAISLDREQREVVLSEEDHTLVIAGAGAGKTTTVAAKVRYLVEKEASTRPRFWLYPLPIRPSRSFGDA